MSKYTKGPWTVSRPRESDLIPGDMMYFIYGPEIIECYEDWGFTEVDARLISAAPDLLEALQSYSLPIDMNNIAVSRIEFGNEAVEKELKRRTAIAKALGETP